MDIAMWSKAHPAWGQRRRVQRNSYAFLVLMRMTGDMLMCPSCHGSLDLDTAEVDRAIPSLDYTPGNITYLCHGCNHGRGILQSTGHDWTYAETYVSDVRRASQGVAIPSEREARVWWDNRPTGETMSRYA